MADRKSSKNSDKLVESREDRLKAALKANLTRRKAQARVRDQTSEATEQSPDKTGQEKDA